MKNTRLSKEYKDILERIPADKRAIGEKLVRELTFMKRTLDDLKDHIDKEGTVEHFVQGKQNFMRENPALKSYNTTVKQYSALYKQLTDLMEKSPETESANAVYDFLKENADV